MKGYGPHRLIAVTVNREAFAGFGTHPDNEEFLLIGDSDTQPMYLAISLLDEAELAAKIAAETLTETDFIALWIKYNDPEVSFFVMRAGVPHGEAIVDCGKKPPKILYLIRRYGHRRYQLFPHQDPRLDNPAR
jgi:hypothetical protein